MAIYSFFRISPSVRSAHNRVEINDREVGEVWRERLAPPNAKAGELKFRWVAACPGGSVVVGMDGGGFSSKIEAAKQLVKLDRSPEQAGVYNEVSASSPEHDSAMPKISHG